MDGRKGNLNLLEFRRAENLKIHLSLPPISFLGYPTLDIPQLVPIFEDEGHEVTVLEPNIELMNLFIEDFEKKIREIFPDDLRFYYTIGRILDFEHNENYILDLLKKYESIRKNWIRERIKEEPDLIYFNFHYFRSSLSSLAWIDNISKELKREIDTKIYLGGSKFYFYGKKHLDLFRKRFPSIDQLFLGQELFEVPLKVAKIKINYKDIPIPNYNKNKIEDYLNFRVGTRILSIEGSRSCIKKCRFCSEKSIWGDFRKKNPERVVKEIEYLRKKYNIKIFRFNDCLINHNINDLLKMCHIIQKRKINVLWGGMCVVRPEMTLKVMKKLKKSGCSFLWIGIESGSQKILKKIDKDIELDVVKKNLSNAKKAGIRTVSYLITGLPIETEGDLQETIKFLKENKGILDSVLFSKYRATKGSYMADNPKEFNLKLKDPYPLEMVFKSKEQEEKHIIPREAWKDLINIDPNKEEIYKIDNFPILTEI